MTRARELGWVIGIVGLLVFYGLVLKLILNPRVPDAYRAFFIDETRDSMDDTGTHSRPLDPDKWVAHDSGKIGYVGFSGPEKEYRWTDGHDARILFKTDCGKHYQGRVLLGLSSLGNQRVIFSLNGSAPQEVSLTATTPQVELMFDPALMRCDLNTLRMQLPDARAPSEQDPRLLGLALRRFAVD